MKKQLTKFETLTTSTNVTYYKVHFGNQWFMVTPWHYAKAKLMPMFDVIAKAKEGNEYEFKWRVGTVSTNKVTFLTQFTLCEEEFSWDGEEQGFETPVVPTPQTPKQPTYREEQLPLFPFDDDDDSVPF